jgi:hypothetical protein
VDDLPGAREKSEESDNPAFQKSVMGHYGFYKKFLKIIFLNAKRCFVS